jgi:hypothetical protein
MPFDTDDFRQSNSLASFRKRLVDSTSGVDADIDGHTVRLSNVPLFREVGGTLNQAIRVRVPEGAPPVTASIGASTITIAPLDRPQSDYLLVPEVREATPVTINVAGQSLEFVVEPQRKFTVHLVLHSHYDIGYTDPQAIVNDHALRYIDSAIELAQETADWPNASRFRWNIEVTWPLREWLRLRPAARREELFDLVRDGVIEINALPFSMHTEAYSQDELAHQLDFAAYLRREHGLEIVSANQTDVPGATIGLVSLLTDAGVKYFTVAHNYAGRSVPFLRDGQDMKRPFWWQAPDGEKLLVWYTDTFSGAAYMEAVTQGIHTDYNEVLGSMPEYLAAVSQLSYPYLADILHGGGGTHDPVVWTKVPYEHDVIHFRVQSAFADNAAPSLASAEIATAWNEDWAWPQLRTSTNRAFFEDITSRTTDFPTYEGDWTDWWADGIGAAARELAFNRHTQSEIRTSQTLHALADALTGERLPAVTEEIQATYDEMALFDEHTWGSGNPWLNEARSFNAGELQWMHKASFAHRARESSMLLLTSGLQRMIPFAAAASENARSLTVFNPSSWARTDLVKVFIPEDRSRATAYTIVDRATGQALDAVFEPQTNWAHRSRGVFAHFLARDVPGLGYARYDVIAGAEQVTLDPDAAAIASIVDKATGREIVEASAPFGFNAYVHDRYATAPTFNHLTGRIDNAGSWLLGARGTGAYGHVIAVEDNAVWNRVTMRASGQGADWLETTITLPHGTNRMTIANRLHKPATLEKESVYFAFPFAGNPAISLEITGGMAGPDDPHVPGSADHFRAMRHFATVTDAEAAPIAWATQEAPLVQLGTIAIPYSPFPSSIPAHLIHDATIFSWALNNLWDTNFPAKQGGELTFTYGLAVGASGDDPAALGRDLGASVSQPLIGVVAPRHEDGNADAEARGSFVSVDHPAVEVLALRSSRDGQAVEVVLFSHAREAASAGIAAPGLPVGTAATESFIGEHREPLAWRDGATVTVAPGETRVVRLEIG